MADTTMELRVGRLIEIRHARGIESVADSERASQLARELVLKIPSDVRVVTVADWRKCSVMSPATAQRTLEMLRHANPRTERAAMLYSERSPTGVMQFIRLLRDADNPQRRMFSDPVELMSWLGEVLTAAEQQRLRVFLADAVAALP